jgi:hypothetical protein
MTRLRCKRTQVEDGRIDVRASLLVDGVGAAGENNSLGLEAQLRDLLGAREHLREDIELSKTAGDSWQSWSVICPIITKHKIGKNRARCGFGKPRQVTFEFRRKS